ncbi:MAG: hypothetical protein E8D45_07845 [Nitrospira sp.]|nr:MAG: hypothetical protein E8D45_07845 [Nitrospira sp.]
MSVAAVCEALPSGQAFDLLEVRASAPPLAALSLHEDQFSRGALELHPGNSDSPSLVPDVLVAEGA